MDRARLHAALYSLPFFVAFGLTLWMLQSDTNLQTNFGAMSSGYFFHWYVILVTAIADIAAALLLLTLRSRLSIKGGVIGSGLLAAIFVGAIFTYAQVGPGYFTSPTSFANYLFGINYGGGDVRYLYDAVLAMYVVSFVWGLVALAVTRRRPASATP